VVFISSFLAATLSAFFGKMGRWQRGRGSPGDADCGDESRGNGGDASDRNPAAWDCLQISSAMRLRTPKTSEMQLHCQRSGTELQFASNARQVTEGWPELPKLIAGEGKRSGKPPRGAGILAFLQEQAVRSTSSEEPQTRAIQLQQGANDLVGIDLSGSLLFRFPWVQRATGPEIHAGYLRERIAAALDADVQTISLFDGERRVDDTCVVDDPSRLFGSQVTTASPCIGRLHVCIVEKANNRLGFPKGGRHKSGCDQTDETVLEAAKREWLEETGIATFRLRLCEGVFLDDDYLGTRYLVASCLPATDGCGDPDEVSTSWAPSFEDPTDDDPIIRAHWLPVSEVLTKKRRFSAPVRALLRRAVEAYEARPPLVSAAPFITLPRRAVETCEAAPLVTLPRRAVEACEAAPPLVSAAPMIAEANVEAAARMERINATPAAVGKVNGKSKGANKISGYKSPPSVPAAPEAQPSALRDSERDVMRVAKKLREVARLAARKAYGEVLDRGQQKKLATREKLRAELTLLVELLPEGSPVIARVEDFVVSNDSS